MNADCACYPNEKIYAKQAEGQQGQRLMECLMELAKTCVNYNERLKEQYVEKQTLTGAGSEVPRYVT